VRYVKPEPEPEKEWEKAGWSREPRNGHEWRMLKAGMPEPGKKDFRKPFRCRKFPGHPDHKTYRVEYQDGREIRRCRTCQVINQRAFYQKNKPKQRRWSKDSRARRRKFKPVFEDGYATISATWLSEHPVLIAELVQQGRLIVEVYGEPAYEICKYGAKP
jgi:hypothetical protein